VALSGFRAFETAVRGPRKARNLRTGEALEIPAGPAIKFKAAKGLKDAVNGGR
jgi:DNA-binding protein HU-beta